MGDQEFIVGYVNACAHGALGMQDCGPVWQLLIIVALLLAAIVTLVVLQLFPGDMEGREESKRAAQ